MATTRNETARTGPARGAPPTNGKGCFVYAAAVSAQFQPISVLAHRYVGLDIGRFVRVTCMPVTHDHFPAVAFDSAR
jgi:hypothetical protein